MQSTYTFGFLSIISGATYFGQHKHLASDMMVQPQQNSLKRILTIEISCAEFTQHLSCLSLVSELSFFFISKHFYPRNAQLPFPIFVKINQ